MRKRLVLLNIAAVIAVSGLVSGCESSKPKVETESSIVEESKENQEYNLDDYCYPGKDNREEVVFGCGNYDLNIYDEYSSVQGLQINVLSYQELNTENVKVSIDIRTPYQVIVSKNEYEEEEEERMIHQALKVCNPDKKAEELSALDIASVPRMNRYVLVINFDMSDEDVQIEKEEFDAVKVSIDEKDYDVNVGNVKLIYGEAEPLSDYEREEGLSEATHGALGYPIAPEYLVDNTFEYSGIMFKTEKDIEITDIGILDDNTLTMKDTILRVSGDMSMDIEYEKEKTIKIKKNSSVQIFMKISDEKLSSPLTYYSNAEIYIKYKCGKKEYMYVNGPTFRTNYYPYEVYAQIVDGIDVVGYYHDIAEDEES